MKLELGTNMIKFINVSLYESRLGSLVEFSSEYEELTDEEQENYWDRYDSKKYKNLVFEHCKPIFEEFLQVLKNVDYLSIIDGSLEEFYSPKYYNYGDDELYFNINTRDDIKTIFDNFMSSIETNNETISLEKFLKEEFKSRVGFISFMPKSIKELSEYATENKGEKVFAAIVRYLMYKNSLWNIEDVNEELIEYVKNEIDYNGIENFTTDTNITEKKKYKHLLTFESYTKKK